MLPPMNHIHQPRDQAAPMPRTTTVTGDQILMTLVLKDHEIINLKDRIAWLERQCEEFAQERDVAMRGNEAREAELQKWRDAATVTDLIALGWKAKDAIPSSPASIVVEQKLPDVFDQRKASVADSHVP